MLRSNVTTTTVTTTTGGTPPAYAQGGTTSEKVYYIQVGYMFNGRLMDTTSIILDGAISENVWHKLALTVEKDSNSTVEVFFDDKYVGSFKENLAPRDVGGVITISKCFLPTAAGCSCPNCEKPLEAMALFKNFEVGRCVLFNSIGQCKFSI